MSLVVAVVVVVVVVVGVLLVVIIVVVRLVALSGYGHAEQLSSLQHLPSSHPDRGVHSSSSSNSTSGNSSYDRYD